MEQKKLKLSAYCDQVKDKSTKILIVVDYQKDFVTGVLAVPGAKDINRIIQQEIYSDKYDYIIYTMDTHMPKDYEGSEEGKIFPFHCEYKTEGWEPYRIYTYNEGVEVIDSSNSNSKRKDITKNKEFMFIKDKFNIWEGNNCYESWFLKNFAKDSKIRVVGVAENYCVYENVMGLIKRGYLNVSILKKAVAGIPDNTLEERRAEMKNIGVKYR